MDAICLTLDVDWAPEWMIGPVIDFLLEHQVKSTWFITHQGPYLGKIREHPDLFEIGIHPNFNVGSTQGSSIKEVLTHCLTLAPDAVSVRSHTLLTSGPILAAMAATRQLRYDSSILLPKAATAPIVTQPFACGELIRIPFVWGDSLEMYYSPSNWQHDDYFNFASFVPVLNFHPIHLHYNHSTLAEYEMNKRRTDISTSALVQPIFKSGSGQMFAHLASQRREFKFLRELAMQDFL